MSKLLISITNDNPEHGYYIPIEQFRGMLDFMRETIDLNTDSPVKALIFVFTENGIKLVIEDHDKPSGET